MGFVAAREIEDRSGELHLVVEPRIIREHLLSAGTGIRNHLRILDHTQQFKARFSAGLRIAQHIAGAAQLQIRLRDFGAIKRALDYSQPLFGDTARFRPGHKEGPRIRATAPDTPAKLMQL